MLQNAGFVNSGTDYSVVYLRIKVILTSVNKITVRPLQVFARKVTLFWNDITCRMSHC